jgi:hypothetical protein
LSRGEAAPRPILGAADEPGRERLTFHVATGTHQQVRRRERRDVELVGWRRAVASGTAMSSGYPPKERRERRRGRRTRDEPPVVVQERVGHEPHAGRRERAGERRKKDPIIATAAEARPIGTAPMGDVEIASRERTSAVGHGGLRLPP